MRTRRIWARTEDLSQTGAHRRKCSSLDPRIVSPVQTLSVSSLVSHVNGWIGAGRTWVSKALISLHLWMMTVSSEGKLMEAMLGEWCQLSPKTIDEKKGRSQERQNGSPASFSKKVIPLVFLKFAQLLSHSDDQFTSWATLNGFIGGALFQHRNEFGGVEEGWGVQASILSRSIILVYYPCLFTTHARSWEGETTTLYLTSS